MKVARLYLRDLNVQLGSSPMTTHFISGSNRIADIDVDVTKQHAKVTDDRGNTVGIFLGGGAYYVPRSEEAK